MILLHPSNEVLPMARVRGAQDYREWPSILSHSCISFFDPPYNTFFKV